MLSRTAPLLRHAFILLSLSITVPSLMGCVGTTIRQLRSDKDMLNQQVLQLKQDSAVFQEKLEDVHQRELSAIGRLEETQATATRLQERLNSVEAELAETKKALTSSSDSRLKQFAERMEQGIAREQELKSKVDALESEVESRNTAIITKDQQIEELTKEVASLSESRDVLKRERDSLEEARTRLTIEKERLEESLKTQQESLKTLEADLASVRSEKESVDTAFRLSRDRAEESDKALAKIEEEKAALQASLDAAKEELTTAKASAPAGARLAAPAKVSTVAKSLSSGLKKRETAGSVKVIEDDGNVRVRVLSDDLFKTGTTILSDGGVQTLTEFVDSLAGVNFDEIVIQGHTDNVPVRNMPYPDNWELAAARATEVTRWLASRPGIPSSKLAAESFSYHRPIGDNATAEGRKLNRRVDILIKITP